MLGDRNRVRRLFSKGLGKEIKVMIVFVLEFVLILFRETPNPPQNDG